MKKFVKMESVLTPSYHRPHQEIYLGTAPGRVDGKEVDPEIWINLGSENKVVLSPQEAIWVAKNLYRFAYENGYPGK